MSLSVLEAAREAPGALALVLGSDRLTFAELAERARRRMGELTDSPRAPLPVLATADLSALVTVYACLELRRPLVPIHARLPAEERDRRAAEGAAFKPVGPPGGEPLAFVYSSGTQGRPRAVELSRRAFVAAAAASAERLGWRDDDRWLLALSFAHVGGLSILVRCLLARRPVVVATGEGFSPAGILELLGRERVSLCSLVPTQLDRLLDEGSGAPPPSLRLVLLGGAAASRSLLERARARGWPVATTYGLTESCAQVATQRPGGGESGVGTPLQGVEVRLVEGRIEIRSPASMTAYHPGGLLPPRTADGFLPTGDLGRWEPDGSLAVLGRGDDLIVTGGENVMPGEVEAALDGCPSVAAACVFGLADPLWGQLVAAAIVPRGGDRDAAALARALRERLAPFQRPRRIAWFDELPLGPTGKLDRRAAARLATGRLEPLAYD